LSQLDSYEILSSANVFPKVIHRLKASLWIYSKIVTQSQRVSAISEKLL